MPKLCLPKDVSTPSIELANRVRLTLDRADYPAFHKLSVDEENGIVVLTGRLPSYYLKQVAQTVVAGVHGVRRVVNDVVVERATK